MRASFTSLLLFLFLISSINTTAQNDFYTKRWSRVYKYEVRSLPKSAVLVVDSIYSRAKKENNITQITKALIYQSKFAVTLTENSELVVIEKFQKEIAASKAPLRNILESMLAKIYWDYLQENRWKYYDRTKTDQKAGNDFRLWDKETMFHEIHTHFQNSLRDSKVLQQTKLESVNDLLAQAENSKTYRPTLYDLIVHNALDFYETGEGYLAASSSDFDLDDNLYFEDFENTRIQTTDTLSPEYLSLKLYQALLVFHKNDKDQSPFLIGELERLKYLSDKSNLANKKELTKAALVKLKATYEKQPASALIDFQVASLLYNEGEEFRSQDKKENQFKKREALANLNKAIADFPSSDGATQCKELRGEILKKSIEIKSEEYIPIGKPARLLATYTNVDSISFYAYKTTSDLEARFHRSINDSVRISILSELKPEKEWETVLPTLNDYQQHSTEVILPALSGGNYLLVSWLTKNRSNTAPVFAYASIQVTNLALIESQGNDIYRYQLVDRNKGRPIEGGRVQFKTEYGHDTLNQTLTSDKSGFLELRKRGKSYYGISAIVDSGDDHAVFGSYNIYENYNNDPEDQEEITARAFLFSDRSIYRPGQTAFFKGILVKTKNKKSSIVSGQYIKVILNDVNGQEVGSLRLKTNSYGSFSGEFKLPANGLTGEYEISVDEDDEDDSKFYDKLDDFYESQLTISVEEYKRPTFEVTFKPVKETYKLNDSITVHGTALTFSGTKISRGKVSYSVKRNVRYPDWRHWSKRSSYSLELEVSHGETNTDAEGEFLVTFKSIPDEKISREEFPVFEFEVTADITDVNGETRSASSIIKIGYHSLMATINCPDDFNRKNTVNTFSVSTENLNGQSVPTKGTVSIYKLKTPDSPQRQRPWGAPDLQSIKEEEFVKLFPNDPYDDQATYWKKGKLMAEIPFNTASSGEIQFKTDPVWISGSYFIEMNTTDDKGNPVTAKQKFELVDPQSKTVDDNKMIVVETDKSVYAPGKIARVKVGSASKDINFVIDVERGEKIIKTYLRHLSGNYIELQIPIGVNDNGLNVHYYATNFNDFFNGVLKLNVLEKKSRMEIETISFKDKLQPGEKETWSFEIKNSDPSQPDTDRKTAEVLASMYDASLDQFKTHTWSFNPFEMEYNYPSTNSLAYHSFRTTDFSVRNLYDNYYREPRLYFDTFDDFGFSITHNQYVARNYFERIYFKEGSGSISKVIQSTDKNLKKGYISGKITDDADETPVVGANVVIKGTTIGTITDANGNYSLPANKGDVIQFSFIGYSTAEAKVGRKNVIDVKLSQDVMLLSEVVVTGFGMQTKRKELGFSVTRVAVADSVAGDVVFEEPKHEAVSELAGKAAGVQITGMPGGAKKIVMSPRFRANKSDDSDAEPLYVVDGVITKEAKIDKDDIANIQVLKGTAATDLYGSQASNGAIIITTKSGQKKLDEELAKINARKNFNETAFFFPHLTTDENGRIQFSFTTPESLTRWKLQLLAHNRHLESAIKVLNTVTQKDFMITPNAPRFLREGDEITFSAKIINLTTNESRGNAALQLTNAVTGDPVDQLFQNTLRTQPFRVSTKGNTQVTWKLKIPQGIDAVQYKVVAKAGNFSDGEQNALPILSNRILVTETLPMFVHSDETKTFTLDKLKNTSSSTLKNHLLTLEVTTNPAWYAVQSLPYLMEFPHECSEQTFARYYANTLAGYVANSNPKIKSVFDQWASSGALVSNLEKNPELKSILIQETPWLRDAQDEAEQKKRIAMLFDLNKMKDQRQVALDKLKELQLEDGGFTWFTGGNYSNPFITQHIATGFGHLRKLKMADDNDLFMPLVTKAILFLDKKISDRYNTLLLDADKLKQIAKSSKEGDQLKKEFLEKQHVSEYELHYLYMRSFFPEIKATGDATTATEYYLKQSTRYWQNFKLYSKGMIALIQSRNQNSSLAKEILRSLKENSIVSEEMGMYWKENIAGWYWYEAPIEVQALLIEAFAEIGSDDKSQASENQKTIDDLRIWLLKNKQTNQWRSTKATTEAIYALLLNGTDWLTLNDKVDISVGGKKVNPSQQSPEVGTGYFKTSWRGNEVKSEMSKVKLTKKGEGIAWVGLYWQYFEDLDKITTAETPLKLSKKLFLVKRTDKGEELSAVDPTVSVPVGSLLRVRIELKSDRDMEFLHMKDMRAAGLEPVDVLSEYKWHEGLGYYQSTKDASTNFFFDSIRKGVYVFEYDLRVNNAGNFSNGITTIQCMYAPEFSSHSEGVRIKTE